MAKKKKKYRLEIDKDKKGNLIYRVICQSNGRIVIPNESYTRRPNLTRAIEILFEIGKNNVEVVDLTK